MKAVSHVPPFRTNNDVVEELTDWDRLPEDPIFQLTSPGPETVERSLHDHGGHRPNKRALRFVNDPFGRRHRSAVKIPRSHTVRPTSRHVRAVRLALEEPGVTTRRTAGVVGLRRQRAGALLRALEPAGRLSGELVGGGQLGYDVMGRVWLAEDRATRRR